jgi:hypothetical protein
MIRRSQVLVVVLLFLAFLFLGAQIYGLTGLTLSLSLGPLLENEAFWMIVDFPNKQTAPPLIRAPIPTAASSGQNDEDDDGDRARPFPRWGDAAGIPLERIVQFVYLAAADNASTLPQQNGRDLFSESLYIFDKNLIWTSKLLRDRTRKTFINGRHKRTEFVAALAIQVLKEASTKKGNSKHTLWPNLQQAVLSDQGAGFPFLFWAGDFRECNLNNWNGTQSVPGTSTWKQPSEGAVEER